MRPAPSVLPFHFERLRHRRCVPEIMDQPGLDRVEHVHALRGLTTINCVSGSDRILWQPLRALAARFPGRRLKILDIACGAGDVPIRLCFRARGAGLNVEIHAGDVSAAAIEHARVMANKAGADVTFFRLDVHQDELPSGFDMLMCSLFLHHLSHDQAVALLSKMRRAAGEVVLINDLLRCPLGLLLAWTGSRLLTTSQVVHVDAPRSVEAAFTLNEIRTLADQAGLQGARLSRRWPFRFLLTWRRR